MNLVNSLGGNMPQERLDSIKRAWMNKTGNTEQQWDQFTPSPNLSRSTVVETEPRYKKNSHEFESVEEQSSSMEFIFCPDWTELGHRYKGKSRYARRLSEKMLSSNPVIASDHLRDSKNWERISKECFQKADDNRRKL